MASFSGIGIGLSIVFGCLLLALVAELYYLLWWKKRISNREIEVDYSNCAKELFYLLCWKKPSSLNRNNTTQEPSVRDPDANGHEHEPDLELGSSKDLLLKSFGEEGIESELMRLHNLSGPPRFLFTIKEETKEDLESDDGRSRKGSRTRSLSDLMVTIETQLLPPLPSPPIKSPPLNPFDAYNHHGFNPLFESPATEAELNSLRSSPPPKFKFLRDAEEKLYRRLMEEAEKRVAKNAGHVQDYRVKGSLTDSYMVTTKERDESSFTFVTGKNQEKEIHHNLPQYPSSSSQVLPLASSPTAFRTSDQNPILH